MPPEIPQTRHQNGLREGRRGRDPNAPPPLAGPKGLDGGGDRGEALAQRPGEALAFLGESEPPPLAVEKRDSQIRLKPAHLLGHSGMGHVERPTRRAEAAEPGCRFEGAQARQRGKPAPVGFLHPLALLTGRKHCCVALRPVPA